MLNKGLPDDSTLTEDEKGEGYTNEEVLADYTPLTKVWVSSWCIRQTTRYRLVQIYDQASHHQSWLSDLRQLVFCLTDDSEDQNVKKKLSRARKCHSNCEENETWDDD